jgi:transcription factor MBP1
LEDIEDDTPDNVTVASASYMAEDDRFDLSQSGHRKRKREEQVQDLTAQQHAVYGDELLDYFLLCNKDDNRPVQRPEPPPNFQPNWPIDNERNASLHWAAAMGDLDLIKQLKRFGASMTAQNIRGETPFMRAVMFTNCFEKKTFHRVIAELFDSVHCTDSQGQTVIHHAAQGKTDRITGQSCLRHYLDAILNKLLESHEPSFVQNMIDAQDHDGNTALHIAAMRGARKCIRALLGRQPLTDIPNRQGIRADELIAELNAHVKERAPQRSSSPFGPESERRSSFRDPLGGEGPHSRQPGGLLGSSFSFNGARDVSAKIAPLVIDKLEDLARNFEEEWREKSQAEEEARKSHYNIKKDLEMAHLDVEELEAQLEPDDVATQMHSEATRAKYEMQSLITMQNRAQVQAVVEQELAQVNGDASVADDSYEARLQLARKLDELVREQRGAETEYVEALSMVGTGDKIEQYRRLLKQCLDHPKDTEVLDNSLDELIAMMEEEKAAAPSAEEGEPMDMGV